MIVIEHDSLVGLLGSSDLLPDDESLEVNVGMTFDELVDNLSLRVIIVGEQLRLVGLLPSHVLDLLSSVEAFLEEGEDFLLVRLVQDLRQVEHKSILVWSVVVSEWIDITVLRFEFSIVNLEGEV